MFSIISKVQLAIILRPDIQCALFLLLLKARATIVINRFFIHLFALFHLYNVFACSVIFSFPFMVSSIISVQ